MKIVNISLCGVFTDGMSYQDNLLPKYQHLIGNDVTIITDQFTRDSNGRIVKELKNDYFYDGVKIIRLELKRGSSVESKFKIYKNLYQSIEAENPDILFVHDCQFLDLKTITKYVKSHRNVKVYIDNHSDYFNSASNWVSKNILHKIIWKHFIKKIEPFTSKFFGVLPARVDFLIDLYNLPKSKCELLVMGADDELVKEASKIEVKKTIREKYNIADTDFLLITGGKINSNRYETLLLMEAVTELEFKNVKLLVFGVVDKEIKEKFDELCKSDRIIFVGWLSSEITYQYFASSDLAVFPGLHSVMWEQVVAQGIPAIFRKIQGFNHIDLNGNVVLIDDVSKRGIKEAIEAIIKDQSKYEKMKDISQNKGKFVFSYEIIAKNSIEYKEGN